MEGKLRAYVEDLFKDAPLSGKTVELREEMIQNLTEKYNDLITEGKTPEAAYNIAVAGLGDVGSLIRDLERDTRNVEFDDQLKKSAVLKSVAVMLYILSALPLISLSMFIGSTGAIAVGLICLFAFIALATGLIIYAGMTRPRYLKDEDSVVAEFKDWQHGTQERKAIRRAISSALWCIIVVVYLLLGVWLDAWHPAWIIFIVGAGIESLLNIFFTYKSAR